MRYIFSVLSVLVFSVGVSAANISVGAGPVDDEFTAQDSLRVVQELHRREERSVRWKKERFSKRHNFSLGFGATPDFPIFSFEYSYSPLPRLEVAFAGSAGHYSYSSPSSLGSGKPLPANYYIKDELTVSAALFVRYSWLNRGIVSLYSSLGLNCFYEFSWFEECTDGIVLNRWYADFRSGYFPLTVEIVPIGLRVGRSFYGFFEPIGYSTRGNFVMLGAGYRF